MSAPKLTAKDIVVATIQNIIDTNPFLDGYEVQFVSDSDAKTILDAVCHKGYKLTYTVNDRDATVRAQIDTKL